MLSQYHTNLVLHLLVIDNTQLSELRPYLPRMQPSALLRGMRSSSSSTREEKEDMATLDLQVIAWFISSVVSGICSIVTECLSFVLGLLPLLQPSDLGKWSFQFSVLPSLSKGMILNISLAQFLGDWLLIIMGFSLSRCLCNACHCSFAFPFDSGATPVFVLWAGSSCQMWHQRKCKTSLQEQGESLQRFGCRVSPPNCASYWGLGDSYISHTYLQPSRAFIICMCTWIYFCWTAGGNAFLNGLWYTEVKIYKGVDFRKSLNTKPSKSAVWCFFPQTISCKIFSMDIEEFPQTRVC